jgi:hypothetical protein
MRSGGKLPTEIADTLGMTVADVMNTMTARFSYDASYLTEQDRKSLLAMELIRTEALLASVWPAAMMGDPKSVDTALRIVLGQHKISGLEQVDPVVQKNLVLVMGDKEEDYINQLKAISDD